MSEDSKKNAKQILSDKNVITIQDALNRLIKENEELKEHLTRAENNLTMLGQELANHKQMTAHIMGRGMGSTVHT